MTPLLSMLTFLEIWRLGGPSPFGGPVLFGGEGPRPFGGEGPKPLSPPAGLIAYGSGSPEAIKTAATVEESERPDRFETERIIRPTKKFEWKEHLFVVPLYGSKPVAMLETQEIEIDRSGAWETWWAIESYANFRYEFALTAFDEYGNQVATVLTPRFEIEAGQALCGIYGSKSAAIAEHFTAIKRWRRCVFAFNA
jgi:hypothetical protein